MARTSVRNRRVSLALDAPGGETLRRAAGSESGTGGRMKASLEAVRVGGIQIDLNPNLKAVTVRSLTVPFWWEPGKCRAVARIQSVAASLPSIFTWASTISASASHPSPVTADTSTAG